MPLEPSSLEADLRRLRAAALDESLLARLDACANHTWLDLDPAEIRFEQQLRGIAPAPLPAALITSFESQVSGVPFPRDEKIVRFPQQEAVVPRRTPRWWAAAAAVALTGAFSALLLPVNHGSEKLAGTAPSPPVTRPSSNTGDLVPAGFNRGLREVSDERVIWHSNDQPHRVLKVVYMDRVTLKDANGRTVQMDQPRVEYILVPAKTD